jgi:hypothetical protein
VNAGECDTVRLNSRLAARDPMSTDPLNELARLKRPDEIDQVFGRANPNPERIGCPSHEVLVALSRRERPIGDRAYDHLIECSPCYLEVRALGETAARRQRGRILVRGVGATVLLATGTLAWWFLKKGRGGTRWRAHSNSTCDRTR